MPRSASHSSLSDQRPTNSFSLHRTAKKVHNCHVMGHSLAIGFLTPQTLWEIFAAKAKAS